MKKEFANIAVFVSGGGTNLQAILDSIDKGIIVSGKVTLVVSNKKDVYALERAKNHNIESL
ncbi:MAG: phosphoribosylglycinamide formyltransferase, partial [Bacilli bacterium]|nr:phosphoribosylglycinamide formyltransferase [Bacilli bacterium]